jgi:hypothetical protein
MGSKVGKILKNSYPEAAGAGRQFLTRPMAHFITSGAAFGICKIDLLGFEPLVLFYRPVSVTLAWFVVGK